MKLGLPIIMNGALNADSGVVELVPPRRALILQIPQVIEQKMLVRKPYFKTTLLQYCDSLLGLSKLLWTLSTFCRHFQHNFNKQFVFIHYALCDYAWGCHHQINHKKESGYSPYWISLKCLTWARISAAVLGSTTITTCGAWTRPTLIMDYIYVFQ